MPGQFASPSRTHLTSCGAVVLQFTTQVMECLTWPGFAWKCQWDLHQITLNVHVVFVALLAMAPPPHFPQLGTTSLAADVPTNLQWQAGTLAYLSEAVTCVCMARAARVRSYLRARPSPVESQLACNTGLGAKLCSWVLLFRQNS